MYLHEVISSGKKFKRSSEPMFLTLDERTNLVGLPTDDLTASDWVTEEAKTDKILAAELVIRLLENLTNEISKHNKEIREEIKDLKEKVESSLTRATWLVNPGTLNPNPPWSITYSESSAEGNILDLPPLTMKTGDPTSPYGIVTSWSKTNE